MPDSSSTDLFRASFVCGDEPQEMQRRLPQRFASTSRTPDLALTDARRIVAHSNGFESRTELVLPSLHILPGDENRSGGALSAGDLLLARNRIGRTMDVPRTGASYYAPFNDVNDDGVVITADLVLVGNRVDTSLPAAPPSLALSASRIAPVVRKHMDEAEAAVG